jgi:hypothetical protein
LWGDNGVLRLDPPAPLRGGCSSVCATVAVIIIAVVVVVMLEPAFSAVVITFLAVLGHGVRTRIRSAGIEMKMIGEKGERGRERDNRGECGVAVCLSINFVVVVVVVD